MILNGIITGLIMGGILSLPVLGVAVIYGITGVPNFAIGVIGVFGGFLTWYFLSFNMGLAILIGVVVCFIVGVVLQRILLTPISEMGGDSTLFFILTVSVGFVFEGLIRAFFPRPNIALELPRIGTMNLGGVTVEGFKIFALLFRDRDARHHPNSRRAHRGGEVLAGYVSESETGQVRWNQDESGVQYCVWDRLCSGVCRSYLLGSIV